MLSIGANKPLTIWNCKLTSFLHAIMAFLHVFCILRLPIINLFPDKQGKSAVIFFNEGALRAYFKES